MRQARQRPRYASARYAWVATLGVVALASLLCLLSCASAADTATEVAITSVCTREEEATTPMCRPVEQPVPLLLNTRTHVAFTVQQLPRNNSSQEQQIADESNFERRAFLCSLDGGLFTACDPHQDEPGAFKEYAREGRLSQGRHEFCARAVLSSAAETSAQACPDHCGAVSCLAFVIDTQPPVLKDPELQFAEPNAPDPFPASWETAEEFMTAFNNYVVQHNGPPFRASRFAATRSATALMRAALAMDPFASLHDTLGQDLAAVECHLTNATASPAPGGDDNNSHDNGGGSGTSGAEADALSVNASFHACRGEWADGAHLASFVTNASLAVMVTVSTPPTGVATTQRRTLFVRGTDAAGNVGPALAFSWSLDTQPALVAIETGRLFDRGSGFSAVPAGQFFFRASDPAPVSAHPTTAQPYCRILTSHGGISDTTAASAGSTRSPPSFQPCTSPWSFDVSPFLVNGTGAFRLQLRALDAAGNADPCNNPTPASSVVGAGAACTEHAFHVATVPPTVSIAVLIPNVTHTFYEPPHFDQTCRGVTVGESAQDGATPPCLFPSGAMHVQLLAPRPGPGALDPALLNHECQLDSTTWFPCFQLSSNATRPEESVKGADKLGVNGSVRPAREAFSNLPDGHHVFRVRATSLHGLVSDVLSFQWSTDTGVAPARLIDAPPAVTTRSWAAFAFARSDTDVASFRCVLDGAPLACANGSVVVGAEAPTTTNTNSSRNNSSGDSGASESPYIGGSGAVGAGTGANAGLGWTPWVNANRPSAAAVHGGGDMETVACSLGQALWAAECRTACPPQQPDCEPIPAQDTGQTFSAPCPTTMTMAGQPRPTEAARVHLQCNHADQPDGQLCFDYEVRVLCGAPANATRATISARDQATVYVDGVEFVGVRAAQGPRVVDIPSATRVLAVAARTKGDATSGRLRVSLPYLGVYSDSSSWYCSTDPRWSANLTWTHPEFDPSAAAENAAGSSAVWAPARVITAPLRADVDDWLSSGHAGEAQWIWAQPHLAESAPGAASATPTLRTFCRRDLRRGSTAHSTNGPPASNAEQPHSAPLASGPHELLVRAVDRVGNVQEEPTRFLWLVDTLPPVLNVTQLPSADNGYSLHVALPASDVPFDTARGYALSPLLEVVVDGQLLPDVHCISPALPCRDSTCRVLDSCATNASVHDADSGACSAQRQALGCQLGRSLPMSFATSHGPHAIALRARDPANNLGPWQTVAYVVDAVVPIATVQLAPPATNSSSPSSSSPPSASSLGAPQRTVSVGSSSQAATSTQGDEAPLLLVTREPTALPLQLSASITRSSSLFHECVRKFECLVRTPGATSTEFRSCGGASTSCFTRAAATVLVQGPAAQRLLREGLQLLQSNTTMCAASPSASWSDCLHASLGSAVDDAVREAMLANRLAAALSAATPLFSRIEIAEARMVFLPALQGAVSAVSEADSEAFGQAEAALSEGSVETPFLTGGCRLRTVSSDTTANGPATDAAASSENEPLHLDRTCAPSAFACLWTCAAKDTADAGSSTDSCVMALPVTPGHASLNCSSRLPFSAGANRTHIQQTTVAFASPLPRPLQPVIALHTTMLFSRASTYAQHRGALRAAGRVLRSSETRHSVEAALGTAARRLAQTRSTMDTEGTSSAPICNVTTVEVALSLSATTTASADFPGMEKNRRPLSATSRATLLHLLAQDPQVLAAEMVSVHFPSCALVAAVPTSLKPTAIENSAALSLILSGPTHDACAAQAAAFTISNTTVAIPLHIVLPGGEASPFSAGQPATAITLHLAPLTSGERVFPLHTEHAADPCPSLLPSQVPSAFLAQLESSRFEQAPVPLLLYHHDACPASQQQQQPQQQQIDGDSDDSLHSPPLCAREENVGEQELLVRAIDEAGNQGPSTSVRVLWDTTPPSLIWLARPSRVVPVPSTHGVDLVSVSFDFQLRTSLPQSVQRTVSALPSAARVLAASYTCALLTTAASASLASGSSSSSTFVAVAASLRRACTPPVSFRVVPGEYVFTVVPTDEVGNEGDPVLYAFSVATAPPPLSLASPLSAVVYQRLGDIPPLELLVHGDPLQAEAASLRCRLWLTPCSCYEACLSATGYEDVTPTGEATPPTEQSTLDAACTTPLSLSELLAQASPSLLTSLQTSDRPSWVFVKVSFGDAGEQQSEASGGGNGADLAAQVSVFAVVAPQQPRVQFAEQSLPPRAGPSVSAVQWLSFQAQRHNVAMAADTYECRLLVFPPSQLVPTPAFFRLQTAARIFEPGAVFASLADAEEAQQALEQEPWFACATPLRVATPDAGLRVLSVRAGYDAEQGTRTAPTYLAWLAAPTARPNASAAPWPQQQQRRQDKVNHYDKLLVGKHAADIVLEIPVPGEPTATEEEGDGVGRVGLRCSLRTRALLQPGGGTLALDFSALTAAAACHNHSLAITCARGDERHQQQQVSAVVATRIPVGDRARSTASLDHVWTRGAAVTTASRRLLLRGVCRAMLTDHSTGVTHSAALRFVVVQLLRIQDGRTPAKNIRTSAAGTGMECCADADCPTSRCSVCGPGICSYDCSGLTALGGVSGAATSSAGLSLPHAQLCDCALAGTVQPCWEGTRAFELDLDAASALGLPSVAAVRHVDSSGGRSGFAPVLGQPPNSHADSAADVSLARAVISHGASGRATRFGIKQVSHTAAEELLLVSGITGGISRESSASDAYARAVVQGRRRDTLPLGFIESKGTQWPGVMVSMSITWVDWVGINNASQVELVVHGAASAVSVFECSLTVGTRPVPCETLSGARDTAACGDGVAAYGPPALAPLLGQFHRVCEPVCREVNERPLYASAGDPQRYLYFDTSGWVITRGPVSRTLSPAPQTLVALRSADDAVDVGAIRQPWRFPDNRVARGLHVVCSPDVLVHVVAETQDLRGQQDVSQAQLCLRSRLSAPPRVSPDACVDVSEQLGDALNPPAKVSKHTTTTAGLPLESGTVQVECPTTSNSALAAGAILLYTLFTVLLSLSIYLTRKREASAIAARHLRHAVLLNSEGLELTNMDDLMSDSDGNSDDDAAVVLRGKEQ